MERGDWGLLVALATAGAVILGALAWAWIGIRRQRRMLSVLGAQMALLQRVHEESGIRVAAVEHEMRTPLSVILGWAILLRDCTQTASQRAMAVDCIVRSARLLQRQVDSLLEVERSRRSIAESALREVALAPVVASVCSDSAPLLEGRDLILDLDEDCRAMADEDALRSILLHLIDNAAKYSDGEIRIRVRGSGGVGEILVEDDGPGLPEHLDLLLPFQRGQSQGEGFGLGLHIVREWAAAMGGGFDIGNGRSGAIASIRLRAPALH